MELYVMKGATHALNLVSVIMEHVQLNVCLYCLNFCKLDC